MRAWHIIGGITLIVLALAAWRISSYEKERNAPGIVQQRYVQRKPTADELVYIRHLNIDSMESARVLNGKSVWMKTGYTLPYYPYRSGRIDFAQPAGWLPPVQELHIKNVVSVTTPWDWNSSIPRGPKNAFIVFAEDGADGEFAAPVATLDGVNSDWACDQIFFYEDPRTLYQWPASVWQAIAGHTAQTGMSELQTSMALGNLQQSGSRNLGNRTVTYTTMDGAKQHHFNITFADNKAASVTSQ